MSTRRTVVAGIGNVMRGDDAAGLLAAHGVGERDPRIDVVEVVDAVELVEVLRAAENVFIIDAVRSGAPAGTVRRVDAEHERLPAIMSPGSTHALDLAATIELARSLGAAPRRIVVYGIEAGCVELGGDVSPAVLAAVESVVAVVLTEVAALGEPEGAQPCTS
jgi:hydrogenase maturation protease